MNDFLGATNVKRVFASVANQPEGPVWSVLFLFEGGAEVGQKEPPKSFANTKPEIRTPEAASHSASPLTGEQVRAVVALKKWRADQAAQEGVPLYMVAQNKWLEEMVRIPVKTAVDLLKVQGLGEWRVKKYGAKIVEILTAVCAAKNSWPSSTYAAGGA